MAFSAARLNEVPDVFEYLFERRPGVAHVANYSRVFEGCCAVGPIDHLVGVFARSPEHVADHHRWHINANVLNEVDLAVGVALERVVIDEVDDLADPVGVIERALRCERLLHQSLEPVMARRILRDQHHPHEVERLVWRVVGDLIFGKELVYGENAAQL